MFYTQIHEQNILEKYQLILKSSSKLSTFDLHKNFTDYTKYNFYVTCSIKMSSGLLPHPLIIETQY